MTERLGWDKWVYKVITGIRIVSQIQRSQISRITWGLGGRGLGDGVVDGEVRVG